MCIDHTDVTQAEPNASSRQGMRHSSHCLHESRRRCSSGEKCRLELLLTSSVSWCEAYVTSARRRDLKRSVMPYRRAFTSSSKLLCAGQKYFNMISSYLWLDKQCIEWNCSCNSLTTDQVRFYVNACLRIALSTELFHFQYMLPVDVIDNLYINQLVHWQKKSAIILIIYNLLQYYICYFSFYIVMVCCFSLSCDFKPILF